MHLKPALISFSILPCAHIFVFHQQEELSHNVLLSWTQASSADCLELFYSCKWKCLELWCVCIRMFTTVATPQTCLNIKKVRERQLGAAARKCLSSQIPQTVHWQCFQRQGISRHIQYKYLVRTGLNVVHYTQTSQITFQAHWNVLSKEITLH